MEITFDIKKFILFHKKRIELLRELVDKGIHDKLIYQISYLGIESLAKVKYRNEKSPGKRFKDLISLTMRKDDAQDIYNWRNSLFHQGYISYIYTMVEGWDDNSFVKISLKPGEIAGGVEYTPETIIALYLHLIEIVEDHFKRCKIEKLHLDKNGEFLE